MKQFKFHEDSGHGWLAVKVDLLDTLGLTEDISSYSYIKGKTAYLEEDCDAGKFIKAYEKLYGKINILSLYSERSPVRLYGYYTPDKVRTILEKNKKIYLK